MNRYFYKCSHFLKALPILLSLFTVLILRGQTLYIGPDNGDWLTATNWNAGLPASGNNATIPGGKIVQMNGSVTVNYTVDNFGTIVNAGTVTVSGAISSGGAFTNNVGASLTVNAGSSILVAGGFSNAGTITNRGTATVNTTPLSNATTGIINNEATWNQFIGVTNDGAFNNLAGTFSCPQIFTNNKTVANSAGATWIVDFGGTYTNATGSTLTNAGTFRNLSTFTNNTTVTNTGTFINNGTHTCNGIFNNNGTGRLESFATLNITGRINNAATATIESGFRFNILTGGYVSNSGTFINRDMIDIKTGATYCNETGSSLTGQFGSSIVNAGYFKVSVNSTTTKNGSLTNNKRVDIFGTYDAITGSAINNNDTLCVAVGGLLKSVNVINNAGVWISKGKTENNGGSVWTNTGRIQVDKGGTIVNNFDLINRPTGSITNNGTLDNRVRLTNEGAILNNAYLVTFAEIFNKTGATLTNTEVVFLSEGSLTNEGTFTNQKTTLISSCAVLSNKLGATINNSGRIESQGTTLQRGTLSGNAIVQQGGFVHTSAASNAPSVCKPFVRAGTDIGGNAKVDAAAVVAAGNGLDECLNIGYFVGGVARITYQCDKVGQTITNIPVKLVLRTGDSLTCTTSVEVFDNVAPVFTNCPKDAMVFSIQDSAAYSWPTVTATDNCNSNINFTSSKASGSNFPIGTTMVTVSARDTFGNVNDCMFRVTVQRVFVNPTCPAADNVAPVFANCPANQTLSTQNGSAAATWTSPSVSDDCYPIVVQQNFNSGQLFQVGTTTVVYTARDSKGNTSNCSFTITVTGPADICLTNTDNIKPVIRNCPANFFGVENLAINGAVGVWKAPVATDNCGNVTLTGTATSGQIFPIGTTAVTYTATDARGNTSTCQFNVLVASSNPCAGDVTPPSLTCPANVTVSTTNGSAIANWTAPTATDACAPVTINSTHQSGQVFALGSTTVNYYASDRVGNQSACGFSVTVVNTCASDTIRPNITNCPANISVVSTNGISATATWTAPSVSDNCTGATLTSNFASGATFGIGTTTVMYTATDARGNQNTCTFTVTVNKSNVATCVGNTVLNASFETDFTDWFTTEIASSTIINDVNSGAKAARLCGDNKPILSKLTTLVGGTYTASAFAKVSGGLTTGVIGIEFYDANGVVIPTARITRPVTATTYTAINFTFTKPANATSFAFLINKTGAAGCICVDDVCITNPCTNDVTPPVLTACPANIVRNLTGTATSTTVTWTAPTATDNCSTPSVISTFPSGATFSLGTTTVRYTATDSKGLTATCAFTVTVNNACAGETTPPSFGTTCPTNKTAISSNGACVAVTWTAPAATDNCSTPSVTTTHAPNFCFPVGSTTVTYTATDANNNRATCSFTVTVSNACATETTPPTFTYCPPATSKVTATTTAAVSWTAPSATDNCSTPTISAPVTSPTAGLTNGGNFPIGNTTVTYTATDARGNRATCSFVVTVTQDVCLGDVTAPSFGSSCPTNKTAVSTNGACVAVNFVAPTATDNCGTPSVSGTHATNFCFPVGTTTVTYVAVDSKNNRSTCSFTVTVSASNPTPVSCAGNLISNFSFESDLTGYSNWGATSITTTGARSGTKAATTGTTAGGFAFNRAVTPLATYTFKSWNKLSGAPTWAGVGIVFYDANWVKLTATDKSATVTGTTYAEYTVTNIAPANAAYASFYVWNNGGGSIITDDWCLTETLFVPDPNKCYRLVNKESGKVIDIAYSSTANNGLVHQWTFNNTSNQKFKFVSMGSGYYSIRATHSNMPLGIENGSTWDYAYCAQRTYDGSNSQQFALQSAGGGYYYLVNRASGKALKTTSSPGTNGTRIYQLPINSGYEHQKWQLVEVACPACYTQASIIVERWNTVNWNFPITLPTTAPTVTNYQGNTQGPWNIGDNYTTRVRGYIKAPTTGAYIFNVTGDDNVEFFLSTNESSANMTRRAYFQGWTNETEYNKYPTQQVTNVQLTAGRYYYFEIRHVEGGGGDGWRLSWCPPNATALAPIQAQYLARSCTNVFAASSNQIFNFEARADFGRAKLEWINNTGYANDFFTVEKLSATTGNFEKLETVNNRDASDKTQQYVVFDNTPEEGDNTYRVVVTYLDGTTKVSALKTIKFKGVSDVNIFPNPASDFIDIDLQKFKGQEVNVWVYNQFGKLIVSKKVEQAVTQPLHLELGETVAGSYLVRIQPKGKREVTKMISVVR